MFMSLYCSYSRAHYLFKRNNIKLLQIEHQQGDSIFRKKIVLFSFLFKINYVWIFIDQINLWLLLKVEKKTFESVRIQLEDQI